MNKFISNSVSDTNKIAADFCELLKPGTVVCMTGDLGAGKTAFVQGVARHLGINDDIMSPTFNILLQYKISDGLVLNHFDLYRLETQEELDDIAFYEVIEDNAISFIEWSEKFPDCMPSDAINLSIKKIDENTREISY